MPLGPMVSFPKRKARLSAKNFSPSGTLWQNTTITAMMTPRPNTSDSTSISRPARRNCWRNVVFLGMSPAPFLRNV